MGDMDRKIPELLKKLRKEKGLSQDELGRMIGGDQTEVSRYERGARLPSRDKLVALAKALSVPVGILAGEEGGEGSPVAVVQRCGSLKEMSGLPQRRSELAEVPLVDHIVAARIGRIVRDAEVKEWLWIPRSQLGNHAEKNLVCVYVKDKSMEPILSEGAVVCIDRDERPSTSAPPFSAAIYAVQARSGELTFRYVAAKGDVLVAIASDPANKNYPVFYLDWRKRRDAIIGLAVWQGSSLVGGMA